MDCNVMHVVSITLEKLIMGVKMTVSGIIPDQ